jgi:hypothetical protein
MLFKHDRRGTWCIYRATTAIQIADASTKKNP